MRNEQLILVDPHTLHNVRDDGTVTIWEMVRRSKEVGVIPALTCHNVLPYEEYLEAMSAFGMRNVVMPGVEWSFEALMAGIGRVGIITVDGEGNYLVAPSAEVFLERDRGIFDFAYRFSREDIQGARDEIYAKLSKGSDRSYEWFRGEVKKQLIMTHLTMVLSLGLLHEVEDMRRDAVGWWVAMNDEAFAAYYLLNKGRGDELLSQLGWEFVCDYRRIGKDVRHRGEVICLLDNNVDLMDKMSGVVDEWREDEHYKSLGVTDLFHFVRSGLSEGEWESLLWYYPHPGSVDAVSKVGKLLAQMKLGDIRMFAPEMFTLEVAHVIHAIEVLNAAHPILANELSWAIANSFLYADKAKMAASDAHDPGWMGSAATAMWVSNLTTEEILEQIKAGRTVPLSGLGELAESRWPFYMWLLTMYGKYLPEFVVQYIKGKIDIEGPRKGVELAGREFFEKYFWIQGFELYEWL